MYRREFLKNSALSIPLFSCSNFANSVGDKLFFEIGLAQWSFNRAITSGEMDNLDFVKVAKKKFDINVVEYVNQFFFNKAKDKNYLKEMLNISDDLGVKNYLIMIDDEGNLGDTNNQKRLLAIENHKKWVEAANILGCAHIRVNAQGFGSEVEVAKNATESLV